MMPSSPAAALAQWAPGQMNRNLNKLQVDSRRVVLQVTEANFGTTETEPRTPKLSLLGSETPTRRTRSPRLRARLVYHWQTRNPEIGRRVAGPLTVQTPLPAASQLPRLATGCRWASVTRTKGHLSRIITSRTFCRYRRAAFFVTAEENALHLKLCILLARAMSRAARQQKMFMYSTARAAEA